MAKRYEIQYRGGFSRIITVDGTIMDNQILHLRKPTEDRQGPDDYAQYRIAGRATELRETTDGVMEDVAILKLERVDQEERDDTKYSIAD